MENGSEDSNENKTPEELSAEKAKADAEAKHAEEQSKLLGLSPEEYIQMIRETRAEAKEKRLKLKEATEKLSAYEKAEADAKEKDLKQKGKYDEIISAKDKLISEYEPKVKEFEEYINKKKQAVKKDLETAGVWTESLNKLPLTELEAIAEKFKTKTPTDSSRNFVNNGKGYEKTPEEKMAGIYKS